MREKRALYERIAAQLRELFTKTRDPIARMATAAALLHFKVPGASWTGWYLLQGGALTVGPYQGPLACLVLAPHAGVCWAGIDRGESVVVPDVHTFPGHIACDPRSRSEIVVPLRDGLRPPQGTALRDAAGTIVGVLDVDSDKLASFDDLDQEGMERIVAMIYG